MGIDMTNIRGLVGDITESNLKYVDYYCSENFGIFIPSVGFCEYAIMPQHTHPAYSFILFFSEEQSITPVKVKMLPEHYLVSAMAPGVPHEEKEADNFTRYIAILISKELFETTYSNYSSKQPEQYCWNQFQVGHDIMIYLKEYMSEYDSKLPGYQDVLEALARTITHQLIRSILRITNKADYIIEKFEIERIVEYMYQHFGEKLTITALAKMVKMSESHFIRIFKKETGQSPMDFLMRVRINKAKKLLRSRSKNITEVSLQCGFSSTSHFSSSFTKHTGITPSNYQKSYAL
ncbi:MAG: helix-turn-helix domain-containing protein [Firmicutes bacterium]|nr:helix-turn-helix domain-containing protein [Bacillota bacterium]